MIPRANSSLSDHIASIFSFMNKYSQAKSPASRSTLGKHFDQYVMVMCWRKMYSRISFWPAVGIVCNLLLVTEEAILALYVDQSPKDVQNRYHSRDDSRLSLHLTWSKDQLGTIHTRHPLHSSDASGQQISFENLLHAAKSSPTSQLYLYNRDTCTEFHDLLISLLVGYAKALHELHELRSLPKDLTISAIRTAWFILHLLWKVTESVAYRMHLDTIQGCIPTVSYSSLDDYKEFSCHVRLGFCDATGMCANVSDDHPDDLISEPDAMETELTPPRLTCKAIILRQVTYSAAKTLLLRYCTVLVDDGSYNLNMPFTTHLIAVGQSEELISWQGIERTLSNIPVELDLRLEVMRVISKLSSQEEEATSGAEAFRQHKSFEVFSKLMEIKAEEECRGNHDYDVWPCVKYPTADHCKLVLAALLKYWEKAIDIDDPELISMIQVRTPFQS
jgi:hypothetical protein